MDEGSTFLYGALVGFPSVSIPGHISVGTGAYCGHHGFSNNMVYDRATGISFDFDYIMSHALDYLFHPEWFSCLYYTFYNEEVETIFEAAHRSFGDWDPASGEGALTASINEPAWVGADFSFYTLLDAVTPWSESTSTERGPGDELSILDALALADASIFHQLHILLNNPEYGLPKLAYISFYSTDFSGHVNGPHGDGLCETMQMCDWRLGAIMDMYREAGVYDDTLFVITADHGMALQDEARSAPWHEALDAEGIVYIDPDGFDFLYFPVLRIRNEFSEGEECPAGQWTLDVYITDDDTLAAVGGADMEVSGGSCDPCTAVTDMEGKGTVCVGAGSGETILIEVRHEDFNVAQSTWSAP